jgi:HAE1 family hydrophobic/amphiphilic exporter-1
MAIQVFLLSFQKQSTASTAEVANAISAQIEKLENDYEGLNITPLMNQGDYINMITGSVLENLLYGGALAILVLLLFLRDIRPTVVIAFSIPVSLMFAVTMMFLQQCHIEYDLTIRSGTRCRYAS